jgi:hypothetical protein
MAYPHHNLAGLGETGELVGIIFEDFETSSDTMGLFGITHNL